MKIYLVGGAVRDELLGLPVRERDWVVVGAHPQELLDAGYKAVGKDFPVFLHPQTGEEYALARTERKTGPGYKGFETQFSPDVTLEQDLERRDLTINAIAKDIDTGALIDPSTDSAILNRVCCGMFPLRSSKIRFACCVLHGLRLDLRRSVSLSPPRPLISCARSPRAVN